MSLHKRLASIEARLRALEAFQGTIEDAIADGDPEPDPKPERDLEGDDIPAERDQTQSLG